MEQGTIRGIDLGTFEGFNFREPGAIERVLTAAEVAAWNHDRDGEAEFWPSGDNAAVAELFPSARGVTASRLKHLAGLLDELGGDQDEALLKIHFLVNVQGGDLKEVTATEVEDCGVQLFSGTSFIDVRREAAYELFELYWPELYSMWEKTPLDGLRFSPDEFLDSPSWTVEEVDLGARKWLLVTSQ